MRRSALIASAILAWASFAAAGAHDRAAAERAYQEVLRNHRVATLLVPPGDPAEACALRRRQAADWEAFLASHPSGPRSSEVRLALAGVYERLGRPGDVVRVTDALRNPDVSVRIRDDCVLMRASALARLGRGAQAREELELDVAGDDLDALRRRCERLLAVAQAAGADAADPDPRSAGAIPPTAGR